MTPRCTEGAHLGPLVPRPDLTRWMRELKDAGLIRSARTQYDCKACGSSGGLTLKRKAAAC